MRILFFILRHIAVFLAVILACVLVMFILGYPLNDETRDIPLVIGISVVQLYFFTQLDEL